MSIRNGDMEREIFLTEDGSSSLRLKNMPEQFHSIHGAIQESKHVYIQNGLDYLFKSASESDEISILEIGFGTGLDALLSALFADKNEIPIKYTGLEAYPLKEAEWKSLNFPEKIRNVQTEEIFEKLHGTSWGVAHKITPYFTIVKRNLLFQEFRAEGVSYNVIYFDAFGAQIQPELWTISIFEEMYKSLYPGGVLVTYSAKGSVKRGLQKVGFTVEKLPGPPGKREMIRAIK